MKDLGTVLFAVAVYAIVGCSVAALVFGALSLSAWLVMLAWNYLAGAFGLPVIGFWHAFAAWFLLTLVAGLFRTKAVRVSK